MDNKIYRQQWREKNRDRIREYGREYRRKHAKRINEQHKAYDIRNREKKNQYARERRWRLGETIPVEQWLQKVTKTLQEWTCQCKVPRKRANKLLNRAVRKGRIIKPQQCEECGRVATLDGHHEDYAKWWVVKWLCRKCHHNHSPYTIITVKKSHNQLPTRQKESR